MQGIGVFHLEGAVAESSDPNRPISIPEGAITFTHAPQTVEDPQLVSYISEHTGKIQPLASADLDSYTMLGRQFLNIGNPMVIPGIGTIEKTNSGALIFKGGVQLAERVEANKIRPEDGEEESTDENMFSDYTSAKKSNAGRKVLIFIGVVIVGLMIWAVWNYAFNSVNEPKNVTEATYPPAPLPESSLGTDTAADSGTSPDSAALPVSQSEPTSFNAVVNQYNSLVAAELRYNNLLSYGRKVILYTSDSVTFKIAEPFNRPLSDTAKVRDSLNAYYGPNRVRIELR